MSRIKQSKCFSVKQVLCFFKQTFIFAANLKLFDYFLFKTSFTISTKAMFKHKKQFQGLMLIS